MTPITKLQDEMERLRDVRWRLLESIRPEADVQATEKKIAGYGSLLLDEQYLREAIKEEG